jgi:hypothetical protein
MIFIRAPDYLFIANKEREIFIMKKLITVLLSVIILITIAACADTSVENEPAIPPTDEPANLHETENPITQQAEIRPENEKKPLPFEAADMPEPFPVIGNDAGGGTEFMRFASPVYSRTLQGDLDGVESIFVEAFVDLNDFFEWAYSFSSCDFDTGLMGFINLFSFIMEFNIPVDELKEIMEYYHDRALELGLKPLYTLEQIDIILSLDEARILEYFISDYAIFHEGMAFTPQWLYWHGTEAYEYVGITPEMIEERLQLFSEFHFTEEAGAAFEEKLSEFTGTEVSFSEIRARRGNDNHQGNDNDQGNQGGGRGNQNEQ